MGYLDKFNPIEPEDLQKREEFDTLSKENQKLEIDHLHEGALIENSDSFYTLLERATNLEDKEELELALKVCEAVKEKGGLALVVGGFARDVTLDKFEYHLKPKDIDIEVYGIKDDDLKKILENLGRLEVAGEAFKVFKLKTENMSGMLDVSIPRRDSKTGKGHKGFKVEGDPNMLVKEAARRRDFTINALALDPLTGEILDFYGGIEDIKNKTLKATDAKTFVEDPLRVLRAVQFAARFGFNIDEETKELCKSLDLTELPKERIGEEWLKLLDKASKPSIGLEAALELGVLDQLHPEIKALIGVPQNPEYHPEGDVWTHTKLVLDAAARVAEENNSGKEEKLILMLAALCHDLGKAVATKIEESGKITSHGHDSESLPLTEKFLKALNINNDKINKVLLLVKDHMFIHQKSNSDPSDATIRRLARRLYPTNIRELANLATADIRGSTRIKPGEKYPEAEVLVKKALELDVRDSKPTPLIMGRDLLEIGFKPGPIVGKTLKEIEELQLDGKIVNHEQAKEHARTALHYVELQSFGLDGLEERIKRGLDPAGMLAVEEVRRLIEEIITKSNINIEDVERITKELHIGAIWDKAGDLAVADKPEVKAWLLLADECHEVNDRDLSKEEYLKDVERIKKDLELAKQDPQAAFNKAVKKIVGSSKERFIKKDGVPFSEEDAFIYMAIAGEKYGICRAGDLYFVGSNELDYSILETEGLIAINKEDRGRMATFFQKDGKDIVKKLYPGLAIVFGDEELAIKLAKSAERFIV